jgi:hypothetical protein
MTVQLDPGELEIERTASAIVELMRLDPEQLPPLYRDAYKLLAEDAGGNRRRDDGATF